MQIMLEIEQFVHRFSGISALSPWCRLKYRHHDESEAERTFNWKGRKLPGEWIKLKLYSFSFYMHRMLHAIVSSSFSRCRPLRGSNHVMAKYKLFISFK